MNSIKAPNGILPIADSKLLIVDWGGDLLEANLKNNKIKKDLENGSLPVASAKGARAYLSNLKVEQIKSLT